MLKRDRMEIPPDVKMALKKGGLEARYGERPPYQRNDYLAWITRAKRPETRTRRLDQMLDELRRGNVYMKMEWRGGGRAARDGGRASKGSVPGSSDNMVRATTRQAWHDWLKRNHATASEAWLVLHRKDSGKPFVEYNDAVDEALCFGWIDSVVKSIGDGARVQRYTPRRKGSSVSEMNRARVRRLVRQRRMTRAGKQALPDVEEWLDPPPLLVAKDIETTLRREKAWKAFQGLPEAYRRIRIGFIEASRGRPDVFEKRLAHFVKMTRAGKRFGMIQE